MDGHRDALQGSRRKLPMTQPWSKNLVSSFSSHSGWWPTSIVTSCSPKNPMCMSPQRAHQLSSLRVKLKSETRTRLSNRSPREAKLMNSRRSSWVLRKISRNAKRHRTQHYWRRSSMSPTIEILVLLFLLPLTKVKVFRKETTVSRAARDWKPFYLKAVRFQSWIGVSIKIDN